MLDYVSLITRHEEAFRLLLAEANLESTEVLKAKSLTNLLFLEQRVIESLRLMNSHGYGYH